MDPNDPISIAYSLSGGYIIRSSLITYPNAHPKDLEIFCECFVRSINFDIGLDYFANFVYADCIEVMNKKNLHLIKEFIIYKYNAETKR